MQFLGALPTEAITINSKIREIDDRLLFKFNEETQDWCLYMEQPRPREPVILCGWPFIPPTHWVTDWLQKNDTQNYAANLLKDMNKANDDLKRHRNDDFLDEVNVGSEKIAWVLKSTKQRKFK